MHGSLQITEFYSVASHPSNGLLLAGGTQDNGTLVFQGNLGWSLITGGDGGDTVFDPSPQNRILYAEVEWFFLGATTSFSSSAARPAAAWLAPAASIGASPDRSSRAWAWTRRTPSTIWLTAEHLFRTDNRAETWTTASPSVGTTSVAGSIRPRAERARPRNISPPSPSHRPLRRRSTPARSTATSG